MSQRYSRSLFIFRRDLRLFDNSALIEALQLSRTVIPCFIFDPRQIEAHAYQSRPALQFMLQSLEELRQELRSKNAELLVTYGLPEQVIERISAKLNLEAVFVNRDYTPFSRQRDDSIEQYCRMKGIDFVSLSDTLLTEPEQVLKADGNPYQVFSAFYKQAGTIPVRSPQPLPSASFDQVQPDFDRFEMASLINQSELPEISGGRNSVVNTLNRLDDLHNYRETRDLPASEGTSRLSAHLKFGTCSIREAYHAIQHQLGPEHPLLRQLYWRDFFTHLGFHFPRVFGHAFHTKYDDLQWDNNQELFQSWTEGRTGFPIVDAGMRELNATGYMHNRVRMITASLLVKDLHIDWRWGERYFAQHLVDYDPCVNNGNWQWAASTGCDAQPYFRIFNPWLQQKKFDSDCRYIKRWVPELTDIPAPILHQWDKKYFQCGYPKPAVNHQIESERAKRAFKACG